MTKPVFTNDESVEEFRREAVLFYARVGECVTAYQQIENRLPAMFRAAMTGVPEASDAIFDVVKGLENRLAIISAAFLNSDADTLNVWNDLSRQITSRADSRNQIANSTPITRGRGIIIDENMAFVGYSNPKSQMELQKNTRAGLVNWTSMQISEEISRLRETQIRCTILFRFVVDGRIPIDYANQWTHPIVSKWPVE